MTSAAYVDDWYPVLPETSKDEAGNWMPLARLGSDPEVPLMIRFPGSLSYAEACNELMLYALTANTAVAMMRGLTGE